MDPSKTALSTQDLTSPAITPHPSQVESALLDRLEVSSEEEWGDPDSTVTVFIGVASILRVYIPDSYHLNIACTISKKRIVRKG